jgi:hypothetical protein
LRKLLALSVLGALSLIATNTAQAHLVKRPDHPKKSVLENRQVQQKFNLAHSGYVCNQGRGINKSWHCKAVSWISRELAKTNQRLNPPYSIPTMWYNIAMCESSLGTGKPQWYINTGNGFYGGLQFDEGTWHEAQDNLGVYWTEYAHQATPEQQVRAAATLPLTRWPHCGAPYR